jgi:hypothetical protein
MDVTMPRALVPATERILARLPGPRALWIALWALVPWLNAAANLLLGTETSAVWEQSDALVVLNYAALSLAVVIALWGSERIARRLEELRATTAKVFEGDAREPFRGLGSVAGPLVLSGAMSVAFAVGAFVRDGWAAAILRGATWFVLGIALWSFLWTYGWLQVGLDRLGRERLAPDVGRLDPGVELRPLGGVAFMGLWMLLAWLVPVLLTSLPDVAGVAIGVAVLIGALAVFFLSLLRLHRRIVEVKAEEVALARELYAEAYEPVRAERTLAALERRQPLLGAADALEKRARAIHEWPIDEATLAWVITVATSVVALTIGRLLLKPLGL